MSAYLEPLEEGRCKKWNLIVSVGSGKERKRKSKAFDGGKREAVAALREFEQTAHIPVAESGFEKFATRWNEARLESGAIAQATHDKYYWFITAVSPYLDKPLESIRPSDIQAAYVSLNRWSGASLRSLHNSLSRIFRAAQADGYIRHNPVLEVDPPKIDTKEKRALSPIDAQDLLKSLDVSNNNQFAISLIVRLGLRRKEVCSLEWHDVGEVAHIRREYTKSNAGVRNIPLDTETKKMIEKRRQLVDDCLRGANDRLRPDNRLCCGLDGRPLTGDALRRWWERHRSDFGLEGWTLHELRHTFLTNLAQAGVHPSVMQKLAGHSSMTTTMQIYTHVNNDDMKAAIDALRAIRK